jgi:hypothetical protein
VVDILNDNPLKGSVSKVIVIDRAKNKEIDDLLATKKKPFGSMLKITNLMQWKFDATTAGSGTYSLYYYLDIGLARTITMDALHEKMPGLRELYLRKNDALRGGTGIHV